jgi:hypothetical protein
MARRDMAAIRLGAEETGSDRLSISVTEPPYA